MAWAAADVLERVALVNGGFEPTTPLAALAALAAVTDRIGLLGTVSTSYSEPDLVACTFATVDHLSGGRAGWNVVTSLNDAGARNFGRGTHLGHADRNRRAERLVDAAVQLWGGRGPVLAQAGSSGPGRALAARVADVVFTRSLPLAQAQELYAGIKHDAAGFGRRPDQVLVLVLLATVVAPTLSEAEDRFAAVRALLNPAVALADVAYWLGADLGALAPDAPLPPLPPTNASAGAQREIYEQAERDGLAIADLARLVADGAGALVGTPAEVADPPHGFVSEAR